MKNEYFTEDLTLLLHSTKKTLASPTTHICSSNYCERTQYAGLHESLSSAQLPIIIYIQKRRMYFQVDNFTKIVLVKPSMNSLLTTMILALISVPKL